MERTTSTHDKAQQVNFDRRIYGTFAEIGAGQEVARWFFQVGGAAGTIAKSISAYDMTFSDAIYGKGERYVSQNRLHNMLEYEFDLLIERLDETRGKDNAFFAFADTVAAQSYRGTKDCHGWMGIKFQIQPKAEPNYIVFNVNLLDKTNLQQQEAIGIIGVNLIHGAFFLHSEPELLIESLLDGLSPERVEVDMIRFYGPYFSNVDNRLMALQLVEKNLTNAALISPDGSVVQPSEVFYKKPILVERGSFRPVTWVNLDMLDGARAQFPPAIAGEECIEVMEITMRNLLATGVVDHKDFLARADLISAVGKYTLISDYARYYRLATYLWRYTKREIGIVLGIPSLNEIFDEKYYGMLEGGILESFGRLFKNDLSIFVYPYRDPQLGAISSLKDFSVPSNLQGLFRHLEDNCYIEPIQQYREDIMHIFSRAVLSKIKNREMDWEEMVPPEVAKIIKDRKSVV